MHGARRWSSRSTARSSTPGALGNSPSGGWRRSGKSGPWCACATICSRCSETVAGSVPVRPGPERCPAPAARRTGPQAWLRCQGPPGTHPTPKQGTGQEQGEPSHDRPWGAGHPAALQLCCRRGQKSSIILVRQSPGWNMTHRWVHGRGWALVRMRFFCPWSRIGFGPGRVNTAGSLAALLLLVQRPPHEARSWTQDGRQGLRVAGPAAGVRVATSCGASTPSTPGSRR